MMNFILKWAGVVALVIALVLVLSPGKVNQTIFGSTSCANITCLEGGLRLVSDVGGDFESDVAAVFNSTVTFGSSGTAVNQINYGSCAIWAAHTIAASTTKSVDCATGAAHSALTGITSTDKVFVQATTSISSTYLGVRIVSAHASTTSGYITLQLYNGTGATFTWSGAASSTIAYQAIK